eukprot:TRINITY_DN9789_c0_g1_i2.p1 TRINITY_DN9789_c0_g1~~TRINITY_DN9789_c0_g1_i2.p1  ORF type:complete len:184 (-),score=13.67 TRINITY_DN9789_c0_g1_i2:92-643(-)
MHIIQINSPAKLEIEHQGASSDVSYLRAKALLDKLEKILAGLKADIRRTRLCKRRFVRTLDYDLEGVNKVKGKALYRASKILKERKKESFENATQTFQNLLTRAQGLSTLSPSLFLDVISRIRKCQASLAVAIETNKKRLNIAGGSLFKAKKRRSTRGDTNSNDSGYISDDAPVRRRRRLILS